MKTECISAVQQAVGRVLNQQEIQGIEDRVRNMLPLARKNLMEAGEPVTRASMLTRAGELAANQLRRDAETGQQRVALGVQARDRIGDFINKAKDQGRSAFDGLGDAIANTDIQAGGIGRDYFSQLMDTIKAAEPRFLGMLENPRAVRDLVFEMFGQDSGNTTAKAGAKAWAIVSESIRQRFNAAGGKIRQLSDWHLPNPHDETRIRTAGLEEWVRDVLPWVDRSRYVQPSGRLLNDVELADVMGEVWRTIESGGVNDLEPGSLVQRKALANRHNEARQLHFNGPEAYLSYHAKYGRGNVYDALQGHVHKLSREIALIETWGPNPDHMFKYFHDVATKEGAKDTIWHGVLPVTTKQLWENVTGRVNQMGEYAKLGEIAQGVRNMEVAGKLGNAFLSSLNDLNTLFSTLHYNRLPMFDGMKNLVLSFGRGHRDYANRAGLIAESVISDMNRWGENNIGTGWTSRLANATMRASFLTAWTDSVRRAFSVTMMGGMGKITRLEWSALEAGDRNRMTAKGITEREWALYRMAKPEDWRGSSMLTPESIKAIPLDKLNAAGFRPIDRERAISRLLAAILDESEYASVGQDIYTRTQLNQGTQKGTIEGEIARSVALFKGYGFALVSRHYMRALHADEAGHSRIAYAATLAVGMTVLGALSLDLKDLKSGKDPRDKTDPRYWAHAFAQGGGGSIYGDLLFAGLSGTGRGGQSGATTLASSLAGPVAGDIFELVGDLGLENIRQAARGNETHAPAEALRFALGHAPIINAWYIRAALDHAILQQAHEFVSPGYLGRMQDRAYKEFGQDFWWRPGEAIPSRAPNFSRMKGD